MKTKILLALSISSLVTSHSSLALAATTIDSANKYAYGANIGWLDWRGDANNGAVVGEYVCSGYVYSPNVGWLNLGSGLPINGIYYQNGSSNDFGVNQDGYGNLRGYAYGANIGWLNFENTGAPKLDLATGKFSGYVYSANCGWISLSNASAFVQTDSLQQGALAPNGLPIAWLLQNFGTTNVDANADPDGDGMSNLQEYLAGTDPNNAGSALRITFIERDPVLANTTLQWTSVPTRAYAVQARTPLPAGPWAELRTLGLGGNTLTFSDTTTNQTDFYRIRAYRPLGP